MMRNDIRNQYGAVIGYSRDSSTRVDYYTLQNGMIGYWDKRIKRYIAIGKGGSGMKAQSDIGTGEVFRLAAEANTSKNTAKTVVAGVQGTKENSTKSAITYSENKTGDDEKETKEVTAEPVVNDDPEWIGVDKETEEYLMKLASGQITERSFSNEEVGRMLGLLDD